MNVEINCYNRKVRVISRKKKLRQSVYEWSALAVRPYECSVALGLGVGRNDYVKFSR